MHRLLRHWLPITAFALAGQAAANVPPEEAGSAEIVVQGSRTWGRQVDRFVDALADAPLDGQLSRFEWALCPAAVGLPQHQNEAVAERMRRVARAADIDVADQDCRPNVLVIAVPNKEAFIASLRREYPAYFLSPLGRRIRVPTGPGPVTAWHVGGLLDADGVPVPITIPTPELPGRVYMGTVRDLSRMTAATRPHFLAAVVVMELDALAGLTTTQLADYAAMRTFARTDPSRLARSSAPTILTLFDRPRGSPVPVTLTHWDLGYLRGLYASRENLYAVQQRHEIRGLVRRDLERTEGAE